MNIYKSNGADYTINKKTFDTKNIVYCFDWDDNIIRMPTKIIMEKKENWWYKTIEVSTEEFANIRTNDNYRYKNNNVDDAMEYFRDNNTKKEYFIEDLKIAMQDTKNFCYSFNAFKNCLLDKSSFAIITARWHSVQVIRKWIKMLIDKTFSKKEKEQMWNIDWYLSRQKVYCVSYKDFHKVLDKQVEKVPIQERKTLAFQHFLDHLNSKKEKFTIWFSDDDKKNIELMSNYMKKVSNRYPNIEMSIYDTSNKNNIQIHKL